MYNTIDFRNTIDSSIEHHYRDRSVLPVHLTHQRNSDKSYQEHAPLLETMRSLDYTRKSSLQSVEECCLGNIAVSVVKENRYK